MLFGHQNDDANQPTPGVNPLAVDPDTGVSLPVAPEELEHSASDAPALDQPLVDAPVSALAAAPVVDDTTTTVTPSAGDDILEPSNNDDLLALKQQALSQLSPLVDHLEQTPEEKFRTTMMLIQSSDNQALIKEAYAAAQQIGDDKVRAQALLDIVNEINYFTHASAEPKA